MDHKLNYSAIETYSIAYTKKVINGFFGMEETITGGQIISLTNMPQVNLLVIKNLLEKWNKETGKFRSPYFNYDAEEVKVALQHFMNVLSNNIQIKKSNFEPLLKKSVVDAILLIFSPYAFYSKEINNPERSRISIDNLKGIRKYIKVNDELLERLIARFQEDDIEEVFNDEGYSILNEIIEEIDLPKIEWEEYLQSFSVTHPLSLQVIFQDADDDNTDEDFDKPLVKHPEKIRTKEKDTHQEAKSLSLNEQFHKAQKTLHEQLAVHPSLSLAELHQRRIDSIKKHITLNQKFMFVNELFSGNNEAYNQALEMLEKCTDYEEAKAILNNECIGKYHWDMEGEAVEEFMEIIEKKFS